MSDSKRLSEPHDLEEGLPLYEELPDSNSTPSVPSKDASPADVRAFIYQAIRSKGGLDEASARTIADKWRLGSGQELRDYPYSMWKDVFGPEESWVVFRCAKLLLLKDGEPERLKIAKMANRIRNSALLVFSALTVVDIVLACLLVNSESTHDGRDALIVISTIIFGIITLIILGNKPSSALSDDMLAIEMKAFSATKSSTSGSGGNTNQASSSSA